MPSIESGGHPDNRQDILTLEHEESWRQRVENSAKPFKCGTSGSEDGKLVKIGLYAVCIKKLKKIRSINDKCLSTQRNTRIKQ